MKHRNVWIILFLSVASAQAQSPAGKWKRTASITQHADGTTSDMQPALIAATPCTANIIYIYLFT